MLENRFASCKNFKDLYEVFSTQDVSDFGALTQAELDRVALVFEANKSDDMVLPVVPLNEQGYEYIWNTVVKAVDVQETVNNVNENQEDETMNETMNNNANVTENNGGFEEIRELFRESMTTLRKGVQVKAGKTKEAYIQQVDGSVNVVLTNFVGIIDKVSTLVGYDVLKEKMYGVIEAGGESKDLFAIAHALINCVDEEVELLKAWGNEESLKKAMALEAATKDERGKSIFESLAAGLVWSAKWVSKKLRQWFQVDNEKSIVGAICRSLSGIVSVLREGAKLVWHTAKFALCFVVGAAIKVITWVFDVIKTVVEKMKGWLQKKDETISDEEADIADDADLEEVVTDAQ